MLIQPGCKDIDVLPLHRPVRQVGEYFIRFNYSTMTYFPVPSSSASSSRIGRRTSIHSIGKTGTMGSEREGHKS